MAMGQHAVPVPSFAKKATAWRIERNSRMQIKGQSNIGSITCDNPSYKRVDTVWLLHNATGDSVEIRGKIQVAMVDFSCHNYFFTTMLRKTLKVEEHPMMTVRFARLDKLPIQRVGAVSKVYGTVEISLAGVTRLFSLPIEVSEIAQGVIKLQGWRICRLEDFNLKSPGRVAFIKVKNECRVEFELQLTRYINSGCLFLRGATARFAYPVFQRKGTTVQSACIY